MNLLIITDNYKQASFVQKCLQMERFKCRLILSSNFKDPEIELIGVEAVLTLITSKSELNLCLNSIIGYRLPIIALANEDDVFYSELNEAKKIDFCFIRPFPFKNMAKKIHYLIFESKTWQRQIKYKYREIELDLQRRELTCKGKIVYLGNKEFSLMQFLMENTGKILTRNQILEAVWDRNANIFTNTVDVHISKLRSKISDQGAEKTIKTIPCVGYLFE